MGMANKTPFTLDFDDTYGAHTSIPAGGTLKYCDTYIVALDCEASDVAAELLCRLRNGETVLNPLLSDLISALTHQRSEHA